MTDLHPSTGLRITENDLRMPQFRDAKIEDLEWSGDGKIARKDRWEYAIRRIARNCGFSPRESFEIDDVVAYVQEHVHADKETDSGEVES